MTSNLEKVVVPLQKDNVAGAATESIWVEPEKPDVYRIKSVPFLAKGFSYDDLVKATFQNGILIYESPVLHNGHSTYQVYIKGKRTDRAILSLVERLAVLQCGIEFASDQFFSVDVKPEANIYSVYAELERAEQVGLIDFQEGHCGHKLSVR
jgi:hypothetical protein